MERQLQTARTGRKIGIMSPELPRNSPHVEPCHLLFQLFVVCLWHRRVHNNGPFFSLEFF
jgi:hypothetical protein